MYSPEEFIHGIVEWYFMQLLPDHGQDADDSFGGAEQLGVVLDVGEYARHERLVVDRGRPEGAA